MRLLLRCGAAFWLLNTLLTFENRWPGFGVLYLPRLSFELCLGVVALMAWVRWRGTLSPRLAWALAVAMLLLVAVRYAAVTAPAVLGRPVNLYWDGRHAAELLQMTVQSVGTGQFVTAVSLLLGGALALLLAARWALATLAQGLALPRPRPWVLAGVVALSLSFAAYVPGERDSRWFFSLPLTPTLVHQARLLAPLLLPNGAEAALGPGASFDRSLSALVRDGIGTDVLLLFAESYGASSHDQPVQAAALADAREQLAQAITASGRTVVSARVTSPTYGGASWLAHAALLSGVDTRNPARHDLLLASQRPTLVHHFARHGWRTVAWMPGIKRPWPEGAFYGFDRVADDAGIGYRGPDFGYWRIPDQAAMALLHDQELAGAAPRAPRFVVFPTSSTHAPFHPLAPRVDDWQRLLGPEAYSAEQLRAALAAPLALQQPLPNYLDALRYQYAWLADYLLRLAPPQLLLVVVGDHQPPALIGGSAADWDVPLYVIGNDPALMQRLLAQGFVPGLQLHAVTLGPMSGLTQRLLDVFDGGSAAAATAGAVPPVGLSAPRH